MENPFLLFPQGGSLLRRVFRDLKYSNHKLYELGWLESATSFANIIGSGDPRCRG